MFTRTGWVSGVHVISIPSIHFYKLIPPKFGVFFFFFFFKAKYQEELCLSFLELATITTVMRESGRTPFNRSLKPLDHSFGSISRTQSINLGEKN